MKQASMAIMNPGSQFLLVNNPSRHLALERELGEILKPKERFYAYGCVLYDDVFNAHHWITYCASWDVASNGYSPCERYNDTGDGEWPN